MSVRSPVIQPPSKVERSLPYSCDAVFLKALNTSASGRHDNAASFYHAVERLRGALVKGQDEGRQGVHEFIEALFPNEALVPGQPGTIDRPGLGNGLELSGLWMQDDGLVVGEEEDTPPDGMVAINVAEAAAKDSNAQEDEVVTLEKKEEQQEQDISDDPDPDAVARVAAWEAVHGSAFERNPATEPAERKPPPIAKPPPIPAKQERPKAQPKSPDAKPDPHSVVVDWKELEDPDEPEDTDEILPERPEEFSETRSEQPLEKAKTPDAPAIRPLEKAKTPIEGLEPVHVDAENEEMGVPTQPAMHLPGAAAPGSARAQEKPAAVVPVPGFKKKATELWQRPWILLGFILGAMALGAILWILVDKVALSADTDSDKSSSTQRAQLTIESEQAARVTLDGEVLQGTTPITDLAVPAGAHKVVVDSLKGERLIERTITLEAGKSVHVWVTSVQGRAGASQDAASEKSGQKKVLRKKKRRRSRRRSRNTP
jgi:hypothetical protein